MTGASEREELRRQRREARRRMLFDTSVPSPCVSVCRLDDATGYCLGCRRTIDEIRDWIISTPDERQKILDALPARRSGNAG